MAPVPTRPRWPDPGSSPVLRAARAGLDRLRARGWAIGQSAASAGVGWFVAQHVLGHDEPFFAAVAGVIGLSASQDNRLRRILELSCGVSIGVGVGDVVVAQIGRGVWQVAFVATVAMVVAVLLDSGALIVTQAGIQSVFVVAMPEPSGGYSGRWLDALVGGAVAFAVAFLLPANPKPGLRRISVQISRELSDALRRAAAGCRAGDAEEVSDALDDMRATQATMARWSTAIQGGAEIVRLSYWRHRSRRIVRSHEAAFVRTDHAVRNLRVAVRRLLAATEDTAAGTAPPVPAAVLDRVVALADALHTLPGLLVDREGEGGRRMRAALGALAGDLDHETLGADSLSATVVVAQLRSAVIDLLQITGLSFDEAKAAVQGG